MSKLHNRGIGGQMEVPSLAEQLGDAGFASAGLPDVDERQDDDAFGPKPELSPEEERELEATAMLTDPRTDLAGMVMGLANDDLVTLHRSPEVAGRNARVIAVLCSRELRRRLDRAA